MSIEIEGIKQVVESIESLADVFKYKQAMGKACALVERDAKKKAPKGNGELRRSITSRVVVEGNEIYGEVYTPLEYAPYVEFGTGIGAFEEGGSGNGRTDVPWSYQDERGEWHTTSGMKPHPYLRPALNENREEINRILAGGIKDND